MKEYLLNDIARGDQFHAWVVFLAYWMLIIRGAIVLVKMIVLFIKHEWNS
jgi:hypothetical protein